MKSIKPLQILPYLLLFIIGCIIVLFSKDFCFFWDNESQLSIPANWFYDNGFSSLFLPDNIATGHPTTFGVYLAIVWKIFGYSLQVSHWAMLPFIFGFLVQSYLLFLKLDLKNNRVPLGMAILITDACILSQSTLVTFEIPLIFFFLLALNSILSKNKLLLVLASTGLCLISLRGMLSCVGILLFDVLINTSNWKRIEIKRALYYVPGFVLISIYLITHCVQRGWAINNTVSNAWAQSSQFASLPHMVRNIAILNLRLFEYGRIFVAILFILIIWKYKKVLQDNTLTKLIIAALSQAIVFFPIIIVSQNAFSTRYFLPLLIVMILISIYFIVHYLKYRFITLGIFLLFNISGYFIVYPQQIAMPWDSTPAHWPFYGLREQMFQYLDSNKISMENISGGFNFMGNQKNIDLKRIGYIDQEPDRSYYIHSNVSNPTDEILSELNNCQKWILLKRMYRNGVFIELYKKQ